MVRFMKNIIGAGGHAGVRTPRPHVGGLGVRFRPGALFPPASSPNGLPVPIKAQGPRRQPGGLPSMKLVIPAITLIAGMIGLTVSRTSYGDPVTCGRDSALGTKGAPGVVAAPASPKGPGK